MNDIFVSYASEDRERVKPIVEMLERMGWDVWWDPEIPLGKNFDLVIEEAIDSARCVVVVWTESSIKSKWVRTEAGEGERRGNLIPILLDDVKIPLAFRRIETAQLNDWDGRSSDHPELAVLFDAIRKNVGKQPSGTSGQLEIGQNDVGQHLIRDDQRQMEPSGAYPPAGRGQDQAKTMPMWVWVLAGLIGIGLLLVIGFGIGSRFGLKRAETGPSTGSLSRDGETGSALGTESCFGTFFEDLVTSRITNLEAGVSDIVVIGMQQSKNDTFGLLLTEGNAPIGALKVNFFSNGDIFKIEALVDHTCAPITYANVADPGEIVLQNWDTIEFQLQGSSYLLRLGFDGGEITAGHFTRIVK